LIVNLFLQLKERGPDNEVYKNYNVYKMVHQQ